MQTLGAMLVTSPGLLEMVTPFSLGMLLELLLGELGPEPGALLHADSTTQKTQKLDFPNTPLTSARGIFCDMTGIPCPCFVIALPGCIHNIYNVDLSLILYPKPH